MAQPVWHVLAAVAPMSVALLRGAPEAAVATGIGAVLIDADHLFDWALNGGREDYTHRIVVPLHGFEFPLALLALASSSKLSPRMKTLAIGLGAGWFCHLLLDFLVNRPESPTGYTLLRRVSHRFVRIPSGWLPHGEWIARHPPNHRAAWWESLFASAVGTGLVLLYGRS